MPQNVISQLRMDSVGRCTVLLTWSSSPDQDVAHYMVNINGSNIANETRFNESVILSSYPLCTCNSENIDICIRAIDSCGRIGQNATYTLSGNPIISTAVGCQDDPTIITMFQDNESNGSDGMYNYNSN